MVVCVSALWLSAQGCGCVVQMAESCCNAAVGRRLSTGKVGPSTVMQAYFTYTRQGTMRRH